MVCGSARRLTPRGSIACCGRSSRSPARSLLVAGIAPDTKEAIQPLRFIKRKAVTDRVRFLGFREDIAELMAAADVLVHPSRLDVTGQVILEAVVNGLPCVVSGVCGFAEHVAASGSGIVLPEPFAQSAFEAALKRLRDPALAAQNVGTRGSNMGARPSR